MTRLVQSRRRAGNPPAWIGMALAAGCALALASCASAPTADVSAEAVLAKAVSSEAGPAIAVHASPWASAATEARVLADRILRRESDGLLLDGARQRALGRGIKRALALIRQSHPAMAEIRVREAYSPATLLLGLEGALRDSVVRLWGDEDLSAVPRTGHAGFDALNGTLGLRAVRPYPSLGAVSLHLGERVNIEAAIGAYEAIDGVAYAEPDAALGDGSDIEAAGSKGTWLVAFRRAWGDCPSGCIDQEISFFAVAGDRATRIEPAQARSMAGFATLLANRGWR